MVFFLMMQMSELPTFMLNGCFWYSYSAVSIYFGFWKVLGSSLGCRLHWLNSCWCGEKTKKCILNSPTALIN